MRDGWEGRDGGDFAGGGRVAGGGSTGGPVDAPGMPARPVAVEDLVGAGLSDEEVVRSLCVGAVELAARTCQWLEVLGEFVVRGLWAVDGARSPAVHLSWRLGIGPSTAREHVRVALRLRELPIVRERFAAGSLSYSKVRAISRIADPRTEALLVAWADASTAAQLERIVADARRAHRVAIGTDDPADRDDLGVRRRWLDDGSYELTLRVDPATGIVVDQHVDRLVAIADHAAARPATPDPGPPVAGSPTPTVGGGADTDPTDVPLRVRAADVVVGALALAVRQAPVDSSGLDRHLAVVELDVGQLARAVGSGSRSPGEEPRGTDGADPDEPAGGASAGSVDRSDPPRAVLVGAGRGGRARAVDVAQLRRVLCCAGADVVGTDRDAHPHPSDLGRARRSPNAALRRLVRARDRACRVPGCGAIAFLQVHHVVPWEHGGATDLGNLGLLCGHHHRAIHTGGWSVRPDGAGRWTFHPDPDRPALDASGPVPPLDDAVRLVLRDAARRHATADAATVDALRPPDHDGFGYDHALTVELLVERLLTTSE